MKSKFVPLFCMIGVFILYFFGDRLDYVVKNVFIVLLCLITCLSVYFIKSDPANQQLNKKRFATIVALLIITAVIFILFKDRL